VELKVLKDVAPDEANVHFLLGRLYKMLRMRGEAVRCFTMALNLDPKVGLCLLSGREGSEVVLTYGKLRPHNSSKTRWRAWTMTMKRKRKRMVRCRSLDQNVGHRQICSVCWRFPHLNIPTGDDKEGKWHN
jgi:hypothetical protein